MFGDVTRFSFSVFSRNSSWRELRELSGFRPKNWKGPLSLRLAVLPHAGVPQYGPVFREEKDGPLEVSETTPG